MPLSLTPEELASVEAFFEKAWSLFVQRRGDNPLAAAGDRERLAHIVATLWGQGVRQGIADEALAQFEATDPILAPKQADPQS